MRPMLGTLLCGVGLAATVGLPASAQVTFPPGFPLPLPSALPPIPGMPVALPGVPGGGSSGRTASVTSSKPEGDLRLAAGVGVDASGRWVLSMPAIRHPDLPNVPVSPALAQVTVSAQMSGSISLTCSIAGTSATQRTPVDLVFINDTTGSMAGTVKGISDSIEKFSSDLSSAGVDARYSMYTYGDAFATRGRPGKFSVGQGDFEPPAFDADARPYVGLTDTSTFGRFLNEMKASGVLGVGGGDVPENTLGAASYAHHHVDYRPGAAKVFVVVGDNPSHQRTTDTVRRFAPNWVPPTGEELVHQFQGQVVAHVVGKDAGGGALYNLRNLAEATGGEFQKLPSDGRVDLGSLGLKNWLISGYRGECTGLAAGSLRLSIRATVIGRRIYTGSLTVEITVS